MYFNDRSETQIKYHKYSKEALEYVKFVFSFPERTFQGSSLGRSSIHMFYTLRIETWDTEVFLRYQYVNTDVFLFLLLRNLLANIINCNVHIIVRLYCGRYCTNRFCLIVLVVIYLYGKMEIFNADRS